MAQIELEFWPQFGLSSPQTAQQNCTQRVSFANALKTYADRVDANADAAYKVAGTAAGLAVVTTATGVAAPAGVTLATFAGSTFLAATGAKGLGTLTRYVGDTVGALATANSGALRNTFMNGVLAGASSGRGGEAGTLAESAMSDAATQPVPNRYSCPAPR